MNENGEYHDVGECAACDIRRIFDDLADSARALGVSEEHIGGMVAGAVLTLLAERGWGLSPEDMVVNEVQVH